MKNKSDSTHGIIFSNGFLIILTGLPSSGKSSFANKLKIHLRSKLEVIQNNNQIEIVDMDAIRIQRYGKEFHPEYESSVRETALREVEQNLKLNKIVISDDVNYYASMRHELVQKSIELELPYFIIHISTPLKKCIRWNRERSKSIEEDIINQIAEKYDVPGKKYKWDKPYRTLDLSRGNLDELSYQLVEEITNFEHNQTHTNDAIQIIKEKADSKEKLEELTKKIVYLCSVFFRSNVIVLETFKQLRGFSSSNWEQEKKKIRPLFEENLNLLKARYENSIEDMNKKRRIFVKNHLKHDFFLKEAISNFLKFLLYD